MPAGTIALTNNSTSVVGTGTDFESELNANDFIVITVGGETYTLGVAAISSGTALTLIRPFSGPTTSGIAWGVVPANTMVRIAAELAEQTTFALRANNIAKINWNAVFSESGDITVTLLDGTTFNGPSWKKIVDLLAEIDVDNLQNLADQVNADAQQVATDKNTASNAATSASGSATAAANSSAAAQTAKTAAETANTNAQQAKTDAVAAKTAAQAAAANVSSMDNLKVAGVAALITVTNLNSIVSPASNEIINFAFAAGATNAPTTSAGVGKQYVAGTTIYQEVYSSGFKWIRTKAGSADWSVWGYYALTPGNITADPWKNLTLAAGFALTSDAANPRVARYRKVFGRVYVEVSGIRNATTASTGAMVLAAVPEGYRPSAITFSVGSLNNEAKGGFYVSPAGNIVVNQAFAANVEVIFLVSFDTV